MLFHFYFLWVCSQKWHLGVICGCILSSSRTHHFLCSLQEVIVLTFFAVAEIFVFCNCVTILSYHFSFWNSFFSFCFSFWGVITYLKVHSSFYRACLSYDEPVQEIISFCCRGSFKTSNTPFWFFPSICISPYILWILYRFSLRALICQYYFTFLLQQFKTVSYS